MSYWISLRCPHCDQQPFSVNVTSNLSPMLALGGVAWDDLRGKTAAEGAARILAPLLSKMEADPAKFQALAPTNGWGTYDGLTEALSDCIQAAADFPKTEWRVS